jgi:RNase P/RNase MRP subunit p30
MKIVQAKDINFNRNIVEKGLADILLSPEASKEKDSMKYLNSGLNGIIVRLAVKNNISIGIDLTGLRSLNSIELGVRLSRIRQNISLCNKAGCKLSFTGQNDDLSARALLMCLGASTQQASKAISF